MADPKTTNLTAGHDPVIRTANIRVPGTATSAGQPKNVDSGIPFAEIARQAMHRLGVLFSRGSCMSLGGTPMDDGTCTNASQRPTLFGPAR